MAFCDSAMLKIADSLNGICLTKKQFQDRVREPVIYFDNIWWSFTHDFVLQWLREQKNVKKVILVGCADFVDDKHYNSDLRFKPCTDNIQNSINFIENEMTQWFKIYKLNPKGILNIPTVNFKNSKMRMVNNGRTKSKFIRFDYGVK